MQLFIIYYGLPELGIAFLAEYGRLPGFGAQQRRIPGRIPARLDQRHRLSPDAGRAVDRAFRGRRSAT